ncbi:MAG: hypothetical protein ACF8NJ_02795 [Phycisphaerales bacterium JB038]
MNGNRVIKSICLLLVLLSLVGMGMLNPRITASASEHQLTFTTEASEGLPPEVAVAVAMGAFRGIAVDYLWIRANRLKQDGKYYEAIQLSDWITKLQPRFPKVWIFHAWNMAYNISVATNTDKERWQWVEAGIRLLRESGIRLNPNDMDLHRELAWIFLHKVGGNTDNVNRYYKREMAKRWHILLGQPPEGQEARVRWLEEIAAAKDTLPEVFLAAPEAERIYTYLTEDLQVQAGMPLLELVERLDASMYRYASQTLGLFERIEQDRRQAIEMLKLNPDLVTEETVATLKGMRTDPDLEDDWDALLDHLRKRILIDEHNMEPLRMARYTRKYGPIDWRNPGAHALYWGQRGVERGLTRETSEDFDQVNSDRIVLQSIQEMRRHGDVDYNVLTGEYILLPNLDFLASYEGVLLELMERDRTRKNAYNLYRSGYFNNLRDAIRSYVAFGDREMAQQYLSKLNREAASYEDHWDHWMYTDLDLFMREELYDRFLNMHVANDHVYQSMAGAFIQLVRGNFDRFRKQMGYAKGVYDYNQARQNLNTIESEENRMALRPFSEIMEAAFMATFLQIGPYQQVVLYRSAPPELRLWVYDDLRESWMQQVGDEETFGRAFPTPVGYEAWLTMSETQRQAQKERDAQRALRFQMQ